MGKPKDDLLSIYNAATLASDAGQAVRRSLQVHNNFLSLVSDNIIVKTFDLGDFDRVIVVGAGKATAAMAAVAEKIFGSLIKAGCISVKYGHTKPLSLIKTIEAGHPVPDNNSSIAAERILELIKETGTRDLVLSLISGGGSSLLAMPPPGISLQEKINLTESLLKCGASIHEINTVRKHISLVKGGKLASICRDATIINLMVSDVVGDDIDVIASGPFVPDQSSFKESIAILKKYRLMDSMPHSVLKHLKQDTDQEKIHKAEDPASNKVFNLIIASNKIALAAASKKARALGYHTLIHSTSIQGDTKMAVTDHAALLIDLLVQQKKTSLPICILSGGETTVHVTGKGKGGRNMEFAMHAANLLQGHKNIFMLIAGTDGSDGDTEAAGAFADGTSVARAQALGKNIDIFIENNDSYHFFQLLGDLLITGPTHTNVMDVRIFLIKPDNS